MVDEKQPKWLPAFLYYVRNVTPPKQPGKCYKITPILDPSRQVDLKVLEALAGYTPRSLEIWKENGIARIIFYAENENVVKQLVSAYPGTKYQTIEEIEPSFIKQLKECPVFFSAELLHALPFTKVAHKVGEFINDLIRILPDNSWTQIVFVAYDYNKLAEVSASKILETIKRWETMERPSLTETILKRPKGKFAFGELKTEFKVGPPPELAASTIMQIGPKIAKDYFEKAHAPGIILHIRGLITQPIGTIAPAFDKVKINFDSLFPIPFKDPRALRWLRTRSIPDPQPFLEFHAKGGFLKPWGKGRELIPVLCLTPQELPVFVHLPTDPNLPVEYTRATGIPTLISTPADWNRLLPHLLDRYHKYIIGMTGAGKTTLLIELMQEWVRQENPPAIIYIDPHGEGSLKALQYLPLRKTVFISPARTGACLNPLELPKYGSKEERERIVFLWLQNFMKLFEEWYASTPETAPRMLHILRTLLAALYELQDNPTLAEIYEIARDLRVGVKTSLSEIQSRLAGKGETALAQDLEAVGMLEKTAFDPILNRLDIFATNPFVKRTFCSESTVNFEKLLKPGQVTLVSLEGVGTEAARIVMAIFLLRLWYYLQHLFYTGKKVWVVLAIDEFHLIRELKIIEELLTQSRKYGLTLILIHQNLRVLSDEMLNTIIGNSGVQIAFRVTGDDASKLARNWDPRYREAIKQAVSILPLYNIYARVQARGGEEQAPPARYLVPPPPQPINGPRQIKRFIRKMKRLFTPKPKISILRRTEKTKWQRYIPKIQILPEREWKLLLIVHKHGGISFSRACALTGLRRDEKAKKAWDALIQMGYLKTRKERIAGKEVKVAELTQKAKNYFLILRDFTKIGGKEAVKIAEKAWEYYTDLGYFVSPLLQTPTEQRHDLVAYDHKKDMVIAIEIESTSEIKTHPEQVMANIKKFNLQEFDELHIWVENEETLKKLNKLIETLPKHLQTRIKTFKTF